MFLWAESSLLGGRVAKLGRGKAWAAPYNVGKYGIRGAVDEDGALIFTVKRGPTTPDGTTMFHDLMDAYKIGGPEGMTEINGIWSKTSTNFQQFQFARSMGVSEVESAFATFTGRGAMDFGFSHLEVLSAESDFAEMAFKLKPPTP
jgi:hypothetical protein